MKNFHFIAVNALHCVSTGRLSNIHAIFRQLYHIKLTLKIAHSLGSLIITDGLREHNDKLNFAPQTVTVVCLGSPMPMFFALRKKKENLKLNDYIGMVKRWYNVYYHHDAVAYRLGTKIFTINSTNSQCACIKSLAYMKI